ncbi:hypothetical protein OPV22_005948 [Ensete ventricosum]|uniref:Uncharacterized protein n=1 Tax=Ensete ventricosum TaxID=4639 RepID=A0AAV8Q2U8_ENSVE|nr:hypothetical protein OPV22_005948 [Ensete ventricosum]
MELLPEQQKQLNKHRALLIARRKRSKLMHQSLLVPLPRCIVLNKSKGAWPLVYTDQDVSDASKRIESTTANKGIECASKPVPILFSSGTLLLVPLLAVIGAIDGLLSACLSK